MMRKAIASALVCVTLLVGGCKPAVQSDASYSAPALPAEIKNVDKGLVSTAEAGLPVAASNDASRWTKLSKASIFPSRPNPFDLHAEEVSFDKQQFASRMFREQGFGAEFEPIPEASTENLTPEPQPYRRLAGILVGDSVTAIIEMTPGQPAQLIRPGQMVGEWRVVSIDTEKAVLRRGGIRPPTQIVVKLEGKPISLQLDAPQPGPAAPPAGTPGQPPVSPRKGRSQGIGGGG